MDFTFILVPVTLIRFEGHSSRKKKLNIAEFLTSFYPNPNFIWLLHVYGHDFEYVALSNVCEYTILEDN